MSLKRIPRVLAFAAGLAVSLSINSFGDSFANDNYIEPKTNELYAKVTTVEVIQIFSDSNSKTTPALIYSSQSEDLPKDSIPEARLVDPPVEKEEEWTGDILNSRNGVVDGPNGKETYYNLDMSGVISIMQDLGYDYEYHIREDGVKMYGPYIICAANLDLRPRGTILETSLGTAIVCDTGDFAKTDTTQIDIAVNW